MYSLGASSDIYDWLQLISVVSCITYWVYNLIGVRNPLWLTIPAFLSLLDPLLPFEFSKTAMLLSITGLHILTEQARLHFKVIGVFLVSLGFLIRPEPGVISMIIFTLNILLNFSISRNKLTVMALPLLSITFLSIVFLNSERSKADEYYKEFRKYEYALVDFRKGLTNEERLDTVEIVKLQAGQEYFFADREELNLAFFKDLDVKGIDKSPISLIQEFCSFGWIVDGWNGFTQGFFELKFHFITMIITSLLLWEKQRTMAWLVGLSLLIIMSFSVFLKTEHHFITSTIMVALLLTGVSTDKTPTENFANIFPKQILITLLMTALSVLMLLEKSHFVSSSKKTSEYYQLVQNRLKDFEPSSLVLNISFWDKLHYQLFSAIQPSGYNEMMIVDGGILYLNDNYQELMFNRSRKSEFKDQFLYLVNTEKLFVSSSERMDLITNYVNTVHNLNLNYSTIALFSSPSLQIPTIGLHKFSAPANLKKDNTN